MHAPLPHLLEMKSKMHSVMGELKMDLHHAVGVILTATKMHENDAS
jgi:hypothetical protein